LPPTGVQWQVVRRHDLAWGSGLALLAQVSRPQSQLRFLLQLMPVQRVAALLLAHQWRLSAGEHANWRQNNPSHQAQAQPFQGLSFSALAIEDKTLYGSSDMVPDPG